MENEMWVVTMEEPEPESTRRFYTVKGLRHRSEDLVLMLGTYDGEWSVLGEDKGYKTEAMALYVAIYDACNYCDNSGTKPWQFEADGVTYTVDNEHGCWPTCPEAIAAEKAAGGGKGLS